jgi:hypothetical protein
MSTALRIVDATPAGRRLAEIRLVFSAPRVTVRDVIRRRITEEVESYNRAPAELFHGWVQPTDAEAAIDGYRVAKPRALSVSAQCAKAFEAFDRNGFFVLAGGRQVESLDEELDLGDDLEVSFVKLVPLVGG